MNMDRRLSGVIAAVFLLACAPVFGAENVVGTVSESADHLLKMVLVRAHPRTLNPEQTKAIMFPSTQTVAKGTAVDAASPILEPVSTGVSGVGDDLQSVRDSMRVQGLVAQEQRLILTFALSGLRNNDGNAINIAKAKAVSMARWSAKGATSFLANDQAGRMAAVALALAYDWLYGHLADSERKEIAGALKYRVAEMLSNAFPYGLDQGRKLDRSPLDSHAISTLAQVAIVCTVMAGHDPVFSECFQNTVPRYVSRPIPWGGNDGGFANGTAYAHWATLGSHYFAWDLLKNALGVDLWQTQWAVGYGKYITYFLPPGTPTGVFGDETEKRLSSVWATQARIYAIHSSSPLADWYARNQLGESTEYLPTLLLPFRDWNQVSGHIPPGTPNSIHIASTGWTAMHSDLGDRARTSVYFKSSPFGSFNHSHADQNGFVIHARGRALAIDSGYYDYYGSPHWTDWYKQTRAHNAITFDGGQGQLHDTLAAKGKITQFAHHEDYDIVTGDALAAYGGALTRAVRTLVYLRPNTIIVIDNLASDTPRTWEWNIHALSRMKENGERSLELNADGVRLCTSMLRAPEGSFTQTDRFTVEPQGKYPAQWHARYAATSKSKTARFVALLDVDCAGQAVAINDAEGGLSVSTGGREIVIGINGEAVLK